jgi:LacI family transcriptional regulator
MVTLIKFISSRKVLFMRADIGVVAKACSVSKTTVSKVFTQKAGVSDAMRRKILDTARRLNYTPKQVMAQDTIAIVTDKTIFSWAVGFRPMLVAAVMGRLTDSGYLIKIISPEEIRLLIGSYTKAAIIVGAHESEVERDVRELKKIGVSTITINEIFEGCHAVCSDHAQAVELAVDHLAEAGHRKISLMIDALDCWGGRERLRGYREAMRKHGLDTLPYRNVKEIGTIVECLHHVRNDGATAVIIEGESMIHEAVYMFNILRIKVPDELSVISSEVINISRWFTPPHTTTHQDLDDMAEKIVECIRHILDGKSGEPCIMMQPAALIKRNSVKVINKDIE